jgi:hypothetical protein
MSQAHQVGRIYTLRMRPKDVGVAIITALCLLGGLLLMWNSTASTHTFQDELSPLRLNYPADWRSVDSLQDMTLKVENPFTPSAFKTSLSVEQRELDPAAPPTLQTLLDRRVEERQLLTGYHFLDEGESLVGGARAMVSEYAYVAQPIDEARRAALPVVVHAREYIVVTGASSYYFTLAAPEAEFAEARRQFDRIIESAVVE